MSALWPSPRECAICFFVYKMIDIGCKLAHSAHKTPSRTDRRPIPATPYTPGNPAVARSGEETMSPEVLSILALCAMFVIATILPVNMGVLAFVGAFLVGTLVAGMATKEIIAGFPGGLFLT